VIGRGGTGGRQGGEEGERERGGRGDGGSEAGRQAGREGDRWGEMQAGRQGGRRETASRGGTGVGCGGGVSKVWSENSTSFYCKDKVLQLHPLTPFSFVVVRPCMHVTNIHAACKSFGTLSFELSSPSLSSSLIVLQG
jgi:hypothetical protein